MTQGNRRFVVKRTATGLGLFAVVPLPARKRLIEYTGPLVSTAEVEQRGGKYFFEINPKWSIDGSPRSNTARYINHSCRPNAEAFISGKRVWVWSKKDIPAGAEITINYGRAYFEDHIKPVGCKCERCRTNHDQKPSKPHSDRKKSVGSGATD
ncbi:MAG: SET domain-containing protein [Acidobacteriota bacterium]|nr:SET domain-containing protein [Acidobacteriota bacterium]